MSRDRLAQIRHRYDERKVVSATARLPSRPKTVTRANRPVSPRMEPDALHFGLENLFGTYRVVRCSVVRVQFGQLRIMMSW